MIRWAIGGIALVTAMGCASPGLAQPQPGNITAADPEGIRTLMQEQGYKAVLTKDDGGDPLIESGANGYEFKVFFYDCTENTNCRAIQFYAGFQKPDHGTLEDLNTWNATKRFTRAYRGDDGTARLEMDVTTDGEGLGRALFIDNLEFWDALMGQFVEAIWD